MIKSFKFPMLLLCLIVLAGCGLKNMSMQDRGLTLCEEAITQHEEFQGDSRAIMASETASKETKKFVVEQINPRLNDLKPVIRDYCEAVLKGGAPSGDEITRGIADITALFATIKKGGK